MAESSAPVLAIRGASAGYRDRRVLRDLDLELERGRVHAIVGATGCGKTTLLHLMAGLVPPERGTVEFPRAEDRRRVALIPQDYGLFPWKTVRSNALMGLEIRDRRRANGEDRRRVEALLAELGIGGLADRWPATLSGGQKQRTAIARALAPEPVLLLMDEPFSALDADIREDLQDLVRSLPARHGTTPVLVTHDIAEAFRVADRLILFRADASVGAGAARVTDGGRSSGAAAITDGRDAGSRFVVECFPNDPSNRTEIEARLRAALRASRRTGTREGGTENGGRDA